MNSKIINTFSEIDFNKIHIFKNVSWEELSGYLEGQQKEILQPGDVLIAPDLNKSKMSILLNGHCSIFLESVNGLKVGEVSPGDCVGEMSVIDNQKPSAWVVASEECEILNISQDVALAMIQSCHDLCLNLLSLLSIRLRKNNQVRQKDVNHLRQIEESATVDSLTGLHNRRWMETMFPREINRSLNGAYTLCAMMIDLDHFKNVNDTHGHLAGDKVLSNTAQVVNSSLRPTDLIVRYGGEEIAILLPTSNLVDGLGIAERVRKAIEQQEILLANGMVLKMTASIGLSEIREGDDLARLLGRADTALYRSKSSGRNQVQSE